MSVFTKYLGIDLIQKWLKGPTPYPVRAKRGNGISSDDTTILVTNFNFPMKILYDHYPVPVEVKSVYEIEPGSHFWILESNASKAKSET